MGKVESFNEFIGESINNDRPIIKFAAGIAIVYNKSILLVHPTNASWQKNTLGIPKGKIEPGEDPLDAAIREVKEEVGIYVNPRNLYPEAFTSPKYNKSGEVESHLIYFILNIENLSEIGLDSIRVPKSQLQIEEVDWAGFINIEDAYEKMNTYQRIILDRLM